jgi:Tfp pilus assembly protein PilF
MSRADPLATHARAQAQFEDGRLEEADATCRAVLKRDKKGVETWALLGVVSMKRQDYAQAEKSYGRCVELSPRDPRYKVLAGNAVALQGRFDEALRLYDEALRLEPGATKASEWKAKVLEWSSRHDDARRVLAPFLEGGSETAPMAEVQARLEMHSTHHEAALDVLDRHRERPDLSPEMRHRLGHLRGRVLEALERYDEAFDAHADAARAVARPFDPDKWLEFADALVEVFSAENLAQLPRHPRSFESHVLIAGMPRSGTTLVEQILDAHPEACGIGEYPGLPEIVGRLRDDLGSERGFPWCVQDLSPPHVARLSQRYTSRLPRVARGAGRVVNKNLENYKCIGLAALLLPGARVIHCRRDPLNTGLSCFMSDILPSAHPYITDLRHIGFVLRESERLMDHWKSVLDLPVLEVTYEDLIDDLEGGVRRMLDFLDLDWDDRCLRYWESGRPVMTMSYDQVRRPIYRSSMKRHERYAKHLEPLREALGL